MWWFYDPCFCTHSKAEIMRIILGFYRPQNALEKVKLWPFESWLRFSYFCLTFSCHPFSAYPLEHTRPTFEKKSAKPCTRVLAIARHSSRFDWFFFSLRAGVLIQYLGYKCNKCYIDVGKVQLDLQWLQLSLKTDYQFNHAYREDTFT